MTAGPVSGGTALAAPAAPSSRAPSTAAPAPPTGPASTGPASTAGLASTAGPAFADLLDGATTAVSGRGQPSGHPSPGDDHGSAGNHAHRDTTAKPDDKPRGGSVPGAVSPTHPRHPMTSGRSSTPPAATPRQPDASMSATPPAPLAAASGAAGASGAAVAQPAPSARHDSPPPIPAPLGAPAPATASGPKTLAAGTRAPLAAQAPADADGGPSDDTVADSTSPGTSAPMPASNHQSPSADPRAPAAMDVTPAASDVTSFVAGATTATTARTRAPHTEHDDNPASAPRPTTPVVSGLGAPAVATPRAPLNAPAAVQLTPIDDPSLEQPAFVQANGDLTATISQPRDLGDGVYQLHAALTPPALGQVDAVVKVDAGNINVVLVAHTAEGHQQLAGHLDQLRQALSQGASGDVQLSLAERGGQDSRPQRQPPTATPDLSIETDSPNDHLLITTPATPAGSSLHIIL